MATSDGISDDNWEIIRQCAEEIADVSSRGADDRLLVSILFSELKRLELIYGRLPSILATKADYLEDKTEELCLLKESYVTACEINDAKNKSYISASLAEFYIEKIEDAKKAGYWLQVLVESLADYSDEYLESVRDDVQNILK